MDYDLEDCALRNKDLKSQGFEQTGTLLFLMTQEE